MANTFEQQLLSTIEKIEKEIELKNAELAEAQKDYQDYKNNKTVVDRLMAKSGMIQPPSKRGRKKKTDNNEG